MNEHNSVAPQQSPQRTELRKRLQEIQITPRKLEAKLIDAMDEACNFLEATAHCGDPTLRFWCGANWGWTGNRYEEMTDDDLRAKLIDFLDRGFSRLKTPAVRDVTMCLESRANVESRREMPCWLDDRTDFNAIALQNGVLNVDALLRGETDVLVPHSPLWFSANCLPYDFDPNANCPLFLRFLERSLEGDRERIAILQEFAGYCLSPTLSYQKFLFNVGEGANGKSVFCAALRAMLGTENVTAVPLEQFGLPYSLYPTLGKLANIASEVGEIDRAAEGILKAFTSGDPMQLNRKYRDLVTASPTAKLVFASNNLPRFSDKSDGLWRRMILMQWQVVIPEGERVRGMDTPEWWRDKNELPGILLWAIAGLHRLQDQDGFTQSQSCAAGLDAYRLESNPARTFLLQEYQVDLASYVKCLDVYENYVKWCNATGHTPMADSSFGKEVGRAFKPVDKKNKQEAGERFNAYFGIAPQ